MPQPKAGAVKDANRLEDVRKKPLEPGSLVGSYFLSDHTRGWQGCVVGEPSPSVYLCETFDWVTGMDSGGQQLVRIEEMTAWTFYDTAEWMRNSYENDIQRLWDHQRKQGEE